MDDNAFIVFSVGPVQSFIWAARSLRDLWTGSFLLSWLTRQAMEPILAEHGKEAFIEPDMTRDPMSREELNRNLRSPCLPNRFLAEVPADHAEDLAEACKQKFYESWREVATCVRDQLTGEIHKRLFQSGTNGERFIDAWDSSVSLIWDAQIDSFFDVRVAVVPWGDCTPQLLESLLGKRETSENWKNAKEEDKLWTDRAELATRVHAAHKAIRKVTNYRPAPDPRGMFAAKCSLLGTYEQMGPAELGESARFWETVAKQVDIRGTKVRSGERLCAVSLVKRFSWPAYFSHELNADPRKMRLEDTATVAAVEWLREPPELDPGEVRKQHGVWSGQWLHWTKPNQEDEDKCPGEISDVIKRKRQKQGSPPTYYAVLVMDGDRMGRHLRGKPGRKHPKAISRALATFALDEVEKIVVAHLGTFIYCGGDDVLALLPTTQAIACAKALRDTFSELWSREMAKSEYRERATLSAGIAVVHYKEDLRFALQTAQQAEKHAKSSGRDILAITVCRRSGEHTTALCPWDFSETLNGWVKAFTPSGQSKTGASDRWARHLYQELPVLKGLPRDAVCAEMRRQVNRAEEDTRRLLWPDNPKHAGEELINEFNDYCDKMKAVPERNFTKDKLLENFLTLCQTAAFLARRKDE